MRDKNFTLIPDLVDLQTNSLKISQFFRPFVISNTNNSIFKIVIKKKRCITLPRDLDSSYEFRDGYYYFKEGIWYYKRRLLGRLNFVFTLELKDNELSFQFNWLYGLVPFQIGQIMPVGVTIRDLLIYHLFLKGYLFFSGSAVCKNEEGFAYVAPSYNGKSTLTYSQISQDCEYLAEDWLLVDSALQNVYPIYSMNFNFERVVNKKLTAALKEKDLWQRNKVPLKKLHFYVNTFVERLSHLKFDAFAFLFTNSLHFLRNRFVRTIILKNNQGQFIKEKIDEIIKKLSEDAKVEFSEVYKWKGL